MHIKGALDTSLTRHFQCDAVITSRQISQTGSNLCKETNTFIRATVGLVKPVCERAGEPYRGMRRSLQPFDVVVCTLKNQGARLPHCQYRGAIRTRRIAIQCEQGLPVHYDGDVVVIND
uniref:Ribonuclease A-domain domain-containing protein n=1 Tax=Cyprinodon variegatus TaxID=28743 RepID=A0A3Q2DVA6_CYPVA